MAFIKDYVSPSQTQGNSGNSSAMIFQERNVEGDDNGDDSEILQSNDNFEMSHQSPVQSPSTQLEKMGSISSRSGSIGRRQKRKSDDTGSELLQLEREKLKFYEKSIANDYENPHMNFF
jgi:hypothetical protein